jgi:ferritin
MIKPTVEKAINEQIMREMYSSNLYLAMSAYFHSINLSGFAHWMRIQAQEESFHAMKFFDYLIERNGTPKISAIPEPPTSWDSALDAFEATYKHECSVTENINELTDIAVKESDHATQILLQWFITEQVEEEANVLEILDKMKMVGDFQAGIFMLDNELKQRPEFTPPQEA